MKMICYSGGAYGADYQFGKNTLKHGGTVKHFYYKEKTPFGNTPISLDEFTEGYKKYTEAAARLGRFITKKEYVLNLVCRNYSQVKNSTVVYAVARFEERTKEDTRYKITGGTAYAVEFAIMDEKLVYFYDQTSDKWYMWDYSISDFIPVVDEPILFPVFTGIGSRSLTMRGIKAIEKLFTRIVK